MEFVELLANPSNIDQLTETQLEQLVGQYPWFYLGKLVAMRHSKNNPERYQELKKSLQLGLNYRPDSKIILQNIDSEIFKKFGSFDIIDSVLGLDSFTITPTQNVANEQDMSAKASSLTDDLATEALAQIFIEQGHNEKAVEIYRQLILKFPKKSAYFARLIEEINKKK